MAKCVLNASFNCLKQLIDCVGSMVNHRNPTFFNIIENVQHMMGSEALDRTMDARNGSRWSYKSVMPL